MLDEIRHHSLVFIHFLVIVNRLSLDQVIQMLMANRDFFQFGSLSFKVIRENRILDHFVILLLFTQEIYTICQAINFSHYCTLKGLLLNKQRRFQLFNSLFHLLIDLRLYLLEFELGLSFLHCLIGHHLLRYA